MKGYRKILLVILVMTIVMIINSFTNVFSLFTYALFLCASFFVVRKVLGKDYDDFRDKSNIIIILIGSIFLYYIITYSTVFFWGVLKNSVGFSFTSLTKNIIPFFLIIVFTELMRFIIIRKGRGYKSIWILAIILFSMMEITIKTKGYDFGITIDTLRFLIEVVAISIVKNIFLCYLVNRTGYKYTILFRSLYDLPLYFLPFFPDLGIFADSAIKMVFPAVMLLVFIRKFALANKQDKIKEVRASKVPKRIGLAISLIFVITIVALSSMRFKYFTIVVGSGSMSPNINKGDIVLVQKTKDITTLKENDILIFKSDNRIVIHRIIKIEQEYGELLFYTQGDANENADFYPVKKKNVVGTAIFKIRYIGYPTVWLSEKMN